jgi:hypothetical protein
MCYSTVIQTNQREDIMNLLKILVLVLIAQLAIFSVAVAGDFDWLNDLSIKAQADPSKFRTRLAVRFNLGDIQIKAVLSNVEKPADAYIVLRLGEISRQPTDYVIAKYRSSKGKGWGALAKSLGIKPGSREFHALKRGHDLYDARGSGMVKGKAKSNGNSKGEGKGKSKKQK